MRVFARRYLISFWIDRAISAGGGNFAPFLPLNWLPWQRPLGYREKRTYRSSAKIVKIDPVDTDISLLIVKKTRNAWQSLAYSPLGTTVSPSSKTKPCYHLANVQRMHVVSVCLHYGKIIWLPWQRPLTN